VRIASIAGRLKNEFAMVSSALTPRFQTGDRVRIDSDVSTTRPLPGHIGIVKEVILNYTDKTIGYTTALEDDTSPGRVWFFLQDQLKPA
jgi:hypothetical protein